MVVYVTVMAQSPHSDEIKQDVHSAKNEIEIYVNICNILHLIISFLRKIKCNRDKHSLLLIKFPCYYANSQENQFGEHTLIH